MIPLRRHATALLALALAWLPARATRAENEPRVAEERVVLHTAAGDIVLALYPDVAPKHVEQILKLVRLGVYDGTHFSCVVPNKYVQLSSTDGRSAPLSAEQVAAMQPLKAEWSAQKHVAGALSMEPESHDPNSARTAFSIMLRAQPEFDGRYTVFGRLDPHRLVDESREVLDEILSVPRDRQFRPQVRIAIEKAEVVHIRDLYKGKLAGARPIPKNAAALASHAAQVEEARKAAPKDPRFNALAGGILVMVAVGIAISFCAQRFPRAALSLVLVNVLIGFFLLLVATPDSYRYPLLAVSLFLGTLAILKLMSRFESPP